MGFAKKIDPVSRIREQFDLRYAVERLGMTVPLEFKNKKDIVGNDHTLAVFASVYVFSANNLSNLLDEIVKHTYEETFNMLKRRMNYEEADD